METVMTQTNLRSRIIASGRTAPPTKKEPAKKRVKSLRIVVIRNSEFVGGRPGD
jgi:hypothetical protein